MALPSRLITQTKQLQLKASNVAVQTAKRALPNLSTLNQQQAGGVIRTVATSTIAQFGNVATQAAKASYDQMRAVADAKGYSAVAIAVKPEKVIDSLVGRSMSLYTAERFLDSQDALLASLGKVIGDIFRETIANNSDFDSMASGYQRVASPGACAFCMVVALNEYTAFEQSGGYHDHCGCTTVPVFKTLGAYRPDYYAQFEQDYTDATRATDSSKAKDILSTIRQQAGRS